MSVKDILLFNNVEKVELVSSVKKAFFSRTFYIYFVILSQRIFSFLCSIFHIFFSVTDTRSCY